MVGVEAASEWGYFS